MFSKQQKILLIGTICIVVFEVFLLFYEAVLMALFPSCQINAPQCPQILISFSSSLLLSIAISQTPLIALTLFIAWKQRDKESKYRLLQKYLFVLMIVASILALMCTLNIIWLYHYIQRTGIHNSAFWTIMEIFESIFNTICFIALPIAYILYVIVFFLKTRVNSDRQPHKIIEENQTN